MNELLQNIDMNGAGLLFLRIFLWIVAAVTGLFGVVAIRMDFDPKDDDVPKGMLKFGLILILVCIGALAILFGGFP